MKTLPALALSILLTAGLAGCATIEDPGAADPDAAVADGAAIEEGDAEDGASGGVTIPGTGDYAIPEDVPIGGFELPNDQDEQPAGCTWALYLANGDLFVENHGPFVFFTDVTARFVTEGCPDWVQFE